MDLFQNKALYHTEIVNADGLPGQIYVDEPHGLRLPASSPLDPQATGTNPEQLIGMALATCLNATIQAEEDRRGIPHQSQVRVVVELSKGSQGFEFFVDGQIMLPHLEQDQAEEFLKIAERRCPVSKLLAGSPNVKIRLVSPSN